jgi:hypothetical protein
METQPYSHQKLVGDNHGTYLILMEVKTTGKMVKANGKMSRLLYSH